MADPKTPAKKSPWMTLAEFRHHHAAPQRLSDTERCILIDQALALFEGVYAHLPLKEAMHGVAPAQRLRILRERHWEFDSDIAFHRELKSVFTSVRDAHTSYRLPKPYRRAYALLPFTVEAFWDGDEHPGGIGEHGRLFEGPSRDNAVKHHLRRRYLVTRLREECKDATPGRAEADRFRVGVEILSWNGIAIDRAVQINAGHHPGSNLAARHSRGIASLTARPLSRSPIPDEDWVHIRYRSLTGEVLDFRQEWLLHLPVEEHYQGPTDDTDSASDPDSPPPDLDVDTGMSEAIGEPDDATHVFDDDEIELALGLDGEGQCIAEASLALFAGSTASSTVGPASRETWPGSPFLDENGNARNKRGPRNDDRSFPRLNFPDMMVPTVGGEPARRGSVTEGEVATIMPRVLAARAVQASVQDPGDESRRADVVFGYIRIFTFDVPDSNLFIAEFVRLAALLPQEGLIIDIRDNPGGKIDAGERLLQVLTPNRIQPERMQFIVTPLTRRICELNSGGEDGDEDTAIRGLKLYPWLDSIKEAAQTGATWSHAREMNTTESCNAIGQKYHGPVVLITSARCYSTADIFAAGFHDHEIGLVLGVDANTGAGGGNVWRDEIVRRALGGERNPTVIYPDDPADLRTDPLNPFTPLPGGARMDVTIRRSLRVGENAGTPLEDLGVRPHAVFLTTKEDLLERNKDLINAAGLLLLVQADNRGTLHIKITHLGAESIEMDLTTQGLHRVDFRIGNRPIDSRDIDSDGTHSIRINANGRTHDLTSQLDAIGYGFTDEDEDEDDGSRENRVKAARRIRDVEADAAIGREPIHR